MKFIENIRRTLVADLAYVIVHHLKTICRTLQKDSILTDRLWEPPAPHHPQDASPGCRGWNPWKPELFEHLIHIGSFILNPLYLCFCDFLSEKHSTTPCLFSMERHLAGMRFFSSVNTFTVLQWIVLSWIWRRNRACPKSVYRRLFLPALPTENINNDTTSHNTKDSNTNLWLTNEMQSFYTCKM